MSQPIRTRTRNGKRRVGQSSRLNLRMRDQTKLNRISRGNRLKLKSIRTIEQSAHEYDVPEFDYDQLENIRLQALSSADNKICYDQKSVWTLQQLDNAEAINGDLDPAQAILTWCMTVLAHSPLAKAMIEETKEEDWQIGFADLDGHDFHLDVPDQTAFLSNHNLEAPAIARSSYFMNATLVGFMRALRDIAQEKRHGGFEELHDPEDVMLLERIRTADLDVISTMVAWDLRENGFPEIWRYLLASESGDIAMAFSAAYDAHPFSCVKGSAPVAAFCLWFDNKDRVNACDRETLDYLDNVIMNTPYDENPFGDRNPTEIGIEILSCLPDKTAYLKGWGGEILCDPHYAGLHDEINQSHLLQIISDINVTYVGGIAFRDAGLAEKLFPSSDSIH